MPSRRAELTPRQNAVLKNYCAGRNDKENAASLGVSERTLEFHWRCALERLGAKTRGQAVLRWIGR